jgi:hypothetical protein
MANTDCVSIVGASGAIQRIAAAKSPSLIGGTRACPVNECNRPVYIADRQVERAVSTLGVCPRKTRRFRVLPIERETGRDS